MSYMNVDALAKLPVFKTADKMPMLTKTKQSDSGQTVDGELTYLANDLKENGCHTPLVLFKGMLLDGRNRIAAAQLAGLDFLPTQEYEGDTPVSYVISINVKRRHLTPTQLDILAVETEEDFAEEAHLRKLATQNNNASADIFVSEDVRGPAILQAAKAVGSGQAEKAKSLKNNAPDLYEKMKTGSLSTTQAYQKKQSSFVNPDGNRVEIPAIAGGGAVTIDKLLDKADRAYDSFMDVIEEMKGAGATTENFMPVINMLNNLLKQAIKTQEAL